MRFVMAYSCGKDSTFALEEMINAGHTPIGLLVMTSSRLRRSFNHVANYELLQRYSEALGVPLMLCEGIRRHDAAAVEAKLLVAKEMGAEAVCGGDIAIDGVRAWNELRAKNAGLKAMFPLWGIDRESYMLKLLNRGYKCLITSIDTSLLPETLLGTYLDEAALDIMRKRNVDICGENGEYHSLVTDCPIFKRPVALELGQTRKLPRRSAFDPKAVGAR